MHIFVRMEIACHISLFPLPLPCVARGLHYFPFFFLKWMSLLSLCTHFHKTRYLSKYLHDKHKLLWIKPVFNSFYYCIARTPKHSQSKNYKILTHAQSISLQNRIMRLQLVRCTYDHQGEPQWELPNAAATCRPCIPCSNCRQRQLSQTGKGRTMNRLKAFGLLMFCVGGITKASLSAPWDIEM